VSEVPRGVLTHGLLHFSWRESRHRQRGDTLPFWPQAVEDEAEVPAPDPGADLPDKLGGLGEREDDEQYVGRPQSSRSCPAAWARSTSLASSGAFRCRASETLSRP